MRRQPDEDNFFLALDSTRPFGLLLCKKCGRVVEVTEHTTAADLRSTHQHGGVGAWDEPSGAWST